MKPDFLSALAAQLFGQVARCWWFPVGFSLLLVVGLCSSGGVAAEVPVTVRGETGGGEVPAPEELADARNGTASAAESLTVPYFPASGNAFEREGFVRLINHSDRAGEVRVDAFDDDGSAHGPLTVSVGPYETVHFNSGDLEAGNPDKGLSGRAGTGQGDWRLVFASELDIEALAYIRTPDGFLTAMHDVLPVAEGRLLAAVFNPGSNWRQVSSLRLANANAAAAEVTVHGIDDRGLSPGAGLTVSIPARASRTYSAAELESGSAPGLAGSLGDGGGKWRLVVESDVRIAGMGLLSSPSGHLTNLSSSPQRADGGVHAVPFFPSASDPMGRQGFVRVINHADRAAEVRIDAFDESDWDYEALTLEVGANQAVHFNSHDLEVGNAQKGLSGSTGAGDGDWRLELSSEGNVEVLAFVRMPDGFLTAMHDVAPSAHTRHRVPFFNPGSNTGRRSLLRLVNPGEAAATVTMRGVDDKGKDARGKVQVRLPARSSRTLSARQLESGGDGFDGALGDGTGKWQLTLTSDRPVTAMSLLSSVTGHVTNLSTAPGRGAGPPESSEEAFVVGISSVVQTQCVGCHVAGGSAGHTRLVFVDDQQPTHRETNRVAFGRYLADVDDGRTLTLDKISGVDHEGGAPVPAGSDTHEAMARFLDLLLQEADRIPTEGELVVGGSAVGEIEEPGDEDWFSVDLLAGVAYRVDVEGAATEAGTLEDPDLVGVYGAGGRYFSGVEIDDDGGEGRNAVGHLTAPSDGAHYVAVAGSRNGTGTYTVSIREDDRARPSDDCPSDAASACSVVVGGSATGEIEEPGDEDWFALELEAGTSYRVDLAGASSGGGTLGDPAFGCCVFGAGGGFVDGLNINNNVGGGRDAVGVLTPEATGTYFVVARGGGTGTYTLSVRSYEDDHPDNATSQGAVELDGSVSGEIEEPGDEDWFAMELEAGTSYRLDLAGASSGGGTLGDPAFGCCVFGAGGGFVDGLNINNNVGGGRDAVGVLTPEATGTYFVVARGGGTGTYTLSVRSYEDDHPDNATSQGAVELDGSVSGEIEEPGDEDWFAMELEAGTSYRLDLAGASSGGGTLEDPEFGCCVFDAGSGYVGGFHTTNDGGEGRDAVGVLTPEATGTYFVVAQARGTGTYTLSLAEYEDDRIDDP